MSTPEPLKPDKAKREPFFKWLIAKSGRWLLSQWEEAQGDEQPLMDAEAEVAIADFSTECRATALTHLGAHYCIFQMWQEATEALEEAESLNRDDIWNYQYDIMLWYCKRKIAEAADAEAEAQEKRDNIESGFSGFGSRKETERELSDSGSWKDREQEYSGSGS